MPPNICIIVLDALRASNLSIYGHSRSTAPNIAELSEETVTYDRATAPSGATVDSVGSMFSGLYPGEHQSGRARQLDVESPLLAEYLSDQGYHTAAFSANPFISSGFGFDTGFDEFHEAMKPFRGGMNVHKFFSKVRHLPKYRRYLRFGLESFDTNFLAHVGNALQYKFRLLDRKDDGARRLTRMFHQFASRNDEPWFAYAHYTETHMNSTDDLPYSVPRADAFRYLDDRPDPARIHTRTEEVSYDEDTVDVHERLYDGAIRYLDRHVGAVVERLKELNQWDDTLFILTADHGECIGEHGLLGHGYLYEPTLHVPLLIKPPAGEHVRTGRRERNRVSLVDLYRTITEAVERPSASTHREVLLDAPDTVLAQDYSSTWDWSRYGTGGGGKHAFYHDEMKLLDLEDVELYDLREDPREYRDLSEERPASRKSLQNMLDEKLDRLDILTDVGGNVDIDFGTKSRLRELGYLE